MDENEKRLHENRNKLLQDLKDNIIEVLFTKQDGNARTLRCTLQHDYTNLSSEQYHFLQIKHDEHPFLITAWDVENNGWRSFNMGTVQYTQTIDQDYK